MLRDLLSLGLVIYLLVSASVFCASASQEGGSTDDHGAGNTSPDKPKPKVRARLTADHLALSSKQVRCILEPVTAADEKPVTVASLVGSLPPGKKLYVVFKDFRTNTQPGVLYTAYLNLPEKAPAKIAREHAFGVLNFFNATISPHPAQAEKSERATKSDRFVSFDITKLARNLYSKERLKDKAVVTLVPAGVPSADAKPIIGEVTLVEQ